MQYDIARLQIPVQNPFLVSKVERCADRSNNAEGAPYAHHFSMLNLLAESRSIEQFEHKIRMALICFIIIEYTDYIRVLDCSGGVGFKLEATLLCRIDGEVAMQQLDCRKIADVQPLSSKNVGHTAVAEMAHKLIFLIENDSNQIFSAVATHKPVQIINHE